MFLFRWESCFVEQGKRETPIYVYRDMHIAYVRQYTVTESIPDYAISLFYKY